MKEPLTKDVGVDEVDFEKIGLDDAFSYLNVSGIKGNQTLLGHTAFI
jgi:hypothetical protein